MKVDLRGSERITQMQLAKTLKCRPILELMEIFKMQFFNGGGNSGIE
jgi:hypothetical protein